MAFTRYSICLVGLCVSSAYASIVTTASCTAVTSISNIVLADKSSPVSCFDARNPVGTTFVGYRVSAEVTTNRVVADATGGVWDGFGFVTATATATATGDDSVIFPGSGLATLRVTLATQAFGPLGNADIGYTYGVDGVIQSAPISESGTTFTDLDYQINLGQGANILWAAQVLASAGMLGREAGGLLFGAPQLRLYDSQGEQMRGVVGAGSDTSYSIFFAADDVSRGPVLSTGPSDQSVPEIPPAGMVSAGCGLLYIVRKLTSSSVLPHVT